jgi:hypothetical protein
MTLKVDPPESTIVISPYSFIHFLPRRLPPASPSFHKIPSPQHFKLATSTCGPPSKREGLSRLNDNRTISRYEPCLSLFPRAFRIDSKKSHVFHLDLAGSLADSDEEMQTMDQTPTPTGTNETFSFSPTAPASQPLDYGAAMDGFDKADDFAGGNPDPFWTEDLFASDNEVIAEEQADLGKMGMGGDIGNAEDQDIYQWREG